jgi:tetratricopeptide (TPR) repeat protein
MIFGGGGSPGGGGGTVTPVQPQQPQVDKIALQRQITQLETLVKTDPQNYQAWKQMGDALFDIGERQRSVEAYTKALEIDDSDPNVWTDMGVMYRQLKKPDKALEAFDEAMKRGPSHTISRLNRGVVLVYDLNRIDEGIAAWEEFLEIQPSGPQADDVRARIAQVRQQQGGIPAVPAVSPDAELPPDHPPVEGAVPAPAGGEGGDPSSYFPKPE